MSVLELKPAKVLAVRRYSTRTEETVAIVGGNLSVVFNRSGISRIAPIAVDRVFRRGALA